LVVVGELFFRCHGLKSGLIMFKMMLIDFSVERFNLETMEALGIDGQDIVITIFALLLVLLISILKERGMEIRETLAKRPVVVRWCVFYGLILFIVIFGAYGLGYIPVDPIYANF